MRNIIAVIILIFIALSCQLGNVNQQFPKTAKEKRDDEIGKLTGEEGIVIGGKRKHNDAVGITVNSYLWRASLEAVSELPIRIVDPFSGVLTTEWYQSSANTNERYKINIIISSDTLRADAVRATVFKQIKKGHDWIDSSNVKHLALEIEDRILSRARQLKIADN